MHKVFDMIPERFSYYVENNYLSRARKVTISDQKIIITLYGIEILREDLIFDGLLGNRDVI